MLGERHVVRQPRTGQLDAGGVDELAAGAHHAVVEVRGGLAVAEHEQLAGALVDLGVGGHAGRAGEGSDPGCLAAVVERQRIELVDVAALPEARQRDAVVHDHVGARGVLHPAARAQPSSRFDCSGRPSIPVHSDSAAVLLGEEPVGAYEAVAVARPSRRQRRSGAPSRRRRTGGTARSIRGRGSPCCAGRCRAGRPAGHLRPRGRGRPTRAGSAATRPCGTGGGRRGAGSTRRC